MSDVVRRYRVQGRVQGVGFRWFVREDARSLGLRGWVRNDPDGDVVLEVGGPASAVERLAQLLLVGPPASHVTSVAVETASVQDAWDLPTPFSVQR